MSRIAVLEDRKSYSNDLITIIKLELPDSSIDVFSDIDSAINAVETQPAWDVWIVDLMMPVGNRFTSLEADYGLATGSRFIDVLLDRDAVNSAIFVVTSRNTDGDKFSEKSPIIQECQKSEVTQVELAIRVRDHLRSVGK
jgi:CheY-like chemotaxis protein